MKLTKEELTEYTAELARLAGREDIQAAPQQLLEELYTIPELLEEYETYILTGRLVSTYSIEGYTLADIVIWQMDHFKALLDDKPAQNKDNQYRMVLDAFETMTKLQTDPEKYISKMQYTTGTDYVEKY